MKKVIKIILSSSFTLALWFYFDDIGNKIKGILFPKKTVLKEIHKEMTKPSNNPTIEQVNTVIPTKTNNTSWLDYLLWGDEGYQEKLKSEGIWETLWGPYLKPKDINRTTIENIPQQLSTHNAVVQTDEQIKDTAIKSVDYASSVLTDYFQNNQSWLDYLIIQGFKFLAILIFFLLVYGLFTILLRIKDKK